MHIWANNTQHMATRHNTTQQDGQRRSTCCAQWPDLYWRRMIRPAGSSVEKDHPSSINTGRTMRRTIGVPCGSSRFYTVFIVNWKGQVFVDSLSYSRIYTQRRIIRLDELSTMTRLTRRIIAIARPDGWSVCLPVFIHRRIITRAIVLCPSSS